MKDTKVLISVVERLHAFDLANQLKRYGLLYKLNTTLPKFFARKWGVGKKEIKSNVYLTVIWRYFLRLPWLKDIAYLYVLKSQAKSNFSLLNGATVFIGWSGSSLEALIEAKKKGIVTILERGSSHYNYQMKILAEEYALFDKEFNADYVSWPRELLEYQLADYISIPSDFVRETFISNGVPAEKLLQNPYGVDLSQFKQSEKKDDIFRIIVCCNLSIRKGVYYILKAFEELNLPHAELWHIGEVNEDMKEIIKQFQSPKISYLGVKSQSELASYYSQGSVFVLTSLEDGFGMVFNQAMACGLPIICSTNTGGKDLITENGVEGFVVPIRDIEALKERILFLYNSPENLAEMSINAKKRVANGYTWDDYGDRYVNILNEICRK